MNGLKDIVKNEGTKSGINKVVDILADKFVLPALEKITNAPQDIFLIYELFKEYLNKRYENNKYMNTIVFKHETKTIDELYIPLTIVENGKRNGFIKVDENMGNIYEKIKRLLIIDTAGTGKSTLVKYMSLFCVKKEWGIPLIIELRRIEKGQTIEQYIIDEICLNNTKIKDADVKEILKNGDFIFFLDGLDEILEENKTYTTKKIRDFIVYANKNSFILTSREDDCLSEFSDFIKYHIQELNRDEAYELIRKYDNYGETSKELIMEIDKDENYTALKEFLGNPLMVSLLYLTYLYKGVLQYKKNIFYRQVYDALYDRHDSTKGVGASAIHEKKSKLNIEDFRRLLCAMGFISIKWGMVEFNKDEMINLINESIQVFPEIETDAMDYFNDILHAVPLFIQEGIKYKWAHKSFAEYFAAVFICQECKEYEAGILKDILDSENNRKFYNLLDFCYDMDYRSVTDHLIYPILKEYVQFCNKRENEWQDVELCDLLNFYSFIEEEYFVRIAIGSRPKDRDVIEDYIDAVDLFSDVTDKRFISYVSYLSKHENVIMITSKKRVHEIVKLMVRKEIDVFQNMKVKTFSFKFLKDLDIGVYNILQNNIDPIIRKNMGAILSYIYHSDNEFSGNVFDVKKCKEKIKEIESEQARIKSNFFSLV